MKKKLFKLKKNFFTIKTRITLWYILVIALIIIVFSFLLYWNMKKQIYQGVKNQLKLQLNQILSELEIVEHEEDVKNPQNLNIRMEEDIKEFQSKNTLVAIYNKDGKWISGVKINKKLYNQINFTSGFFIIDQKSIGNWALQIAPIRQNQNLIGWLCLFRSIKDEEEVLERLITILLFGVPLTLLIANNGGYFLAKKALSPINGIINTAREIKSSNLSHRIEETETDDEIGNLISTLNNLFDSLEKSFERQKRFTADASHDLRTPITVIRTQVEEILRKERSKDEYRQVLEKVLKQIKYMGQLVDQLLQLARADIGKEKLQLETIDLAQLISLVTEEMKQIASRKGLKIKCIINNDEELYIKGDQANLTQLFINLIDNAIKYTPSGGDITVKAEKVGEEIMVQIIDTGKGIPEEDQEKIFNRFYKVDKSRSRKENKGSGLGLAICDWIVKAHGGRINVESQPDQGTTFTIYLKSNISRSG